VKGQHKRRGAVFRAFERAVLGAGLTLMAWIIERRLIKALKKGRVEPAPRTAGDGEGGEEDLPGAPPTGRPGGETRRVRLTAAPDEVGDQARR
jgi:hypothetical protein